MATQANTLDAEIWKPVVGYEGFYEVSNLGAIRSVSRRVNSKNGSTSFKAGRLLKQHRSKLTGYLDVTLSRGNVIKTYTVHRLVCEAFHGPGDGLHVAHNDGTRDNNRADNLRWATPKENAADRNLHGTSPQGEGAGNSKLTEADVLEIRRQYQGKWGDLARLSRQFKICPSQVQHIVRREQWGHI